MEPGNEEHKRVCYKIIEQIKLPQVYKNKAETVDWKRESWEESGKGERGSWGLCYKSENTV